MHHFSSSCLGEHMLGSRSSHLAVLDVLEIHIIYGQHLISFLQPSSVCI